MTGRKPAKLGSLKPSRTARGRSGGAGSSSASNAPAEGTSASTLSDSVKTEPVASSSTSNQDISMISYGLANDADGAGSSSQALKFAPKATTRRKPVKTEAPPPSETPSTDRKSGRGGRGGRGRGGLADRGPKKPIEMTASGPFALGPALQAKSSSYGGPGGSSGAVSIRAGVTQPKEDDQMLFDDKAADDEDLGGEVFDTSDPLRPTVIDFEASVSLRKPKVQVKKEPSEDPMELDVNKFHRDHALSTDSRGAEDKLFLFQLPKVLPLMTDLTKERAGAHTPTETPDTSDYGVDAYVKPEPGTLFLPPEKDHRAVQGRLRTYASGRMTIVLGDDVEFDLFHQGPSSFAQEVIRLEPGKEDVVQPYAAYLGPVEDRFVGTPSF